LLLTRDLLEKTESYLSKPILASVIRTSGKNFLYILPESKIDESVALLSSQIPKPLWVRDRNPVGASTGITMFNVNGRRKQTKQGIQRLRWQMINK
jgi:hypothetical protein